MKKILFVFALLFSVQFVMAQSMSDEQVLQFIESEYKKGTEQQEIAAKLMKKGVSMSQLQRVKGKAEASETYKSKKELREQSKQQSRYNNMVTYEYGENEKLSDEERLEMFEEEQGVVNINNEITSKDKKEIFGRNIFNNRYLTFEPARNTPVPSTYILGAGDQVVIDIWGASQNIIEKEITPEGYIMLEGVGPLYLSGKSIAEANNYVKAALQDVYSESSINLSVASVRSILVQVLGEVTAPGSYTLSALSTAFNALYAAGGITGVGTLRDIKVYRGGKLLATIDVYDYILNGKTADNVHLQDNDVISVGTYNILANIQGKVKRPMFYELKNGEKLTSLFDYSGGYTGDAYREKVRVIRKNGKEYSMHTVEKNDFSSFEMCDGDHVTVDSMIPRYSNMVEINGAVFYPGQYQFGEDVKTVHDLIETAGGVREDAFLERAVLHHRNHDNTIEAKAIDVNAILYGTAPDIALRNNDAIFIPSRSEMEGELIVKVYGEVNFAGIYKYAENTTIQDIILQAGGLKRSASMARIDLYRNKYNPYATQKTQEVETYTFELKNGYVIEGGEQFTLQPFDEIHVRRNPTFMELQNVSIDGEVSFPGEYAMSKTEYRLSDLVKVAGGFSKDAYIKGAFLYRKMNELEVEQRVITIKNNQIQIYEELLSSVESNPGFIDSLISVKLSSVTTYQVAINLEKAMANPGSEYDVILRDGDILTIPTKVSTIKVSGEVRNPITMNWGKDYKLKDYIEHAGGYTDVAKKKAVYIIAMNGNIKKASEISKKDIEPGCEIFVPRKRYVSDGHIKNLMTYGTASASILSMIALFVNSLK